MTESRPHKPKISYQECDKLVCAYRDNGDQEAAAQLIDAFEGYLKKFYNIVRKGKVSIQDRDVREFLKLYMKSEYGRRHIHQYRHMPLIQQEIYSVGERIRSLCESFQDDELMNEIIIALLIMAKRYRSPDGNPRFHTYVLQAFHYQLCRQLQELISDPISFKALQNVHFHEEYYDDERDERLAGDNYNLEEHIDTSERFTVDGLLDSVNDNWVLGITTGEDYKEFTIMERKIIKLYYLDNMSDQDIADELGTCRATVNRRRNHVIRKLAKTFRKKKLIEQEFSE